MHATKKHKEEDREEQRDNSIVSLEGDCTCFLGMHATIAEVSGSHSPSLAFGEAVTVF